MKAGIVGLEFAGKKSLFSLLTGIGEDHPSGKKKEIAAINVPDDRVDFLTRLYDSKKKVYSQIEFDLIPSIKKESKDTNQALIEAKEVDLFAVVLRQFKDENVFHPLESIDLVRDFDIIKNEFILADLIQIENRLERIEKQLKTIKKDLLIKEKDLLIRLKEKLEAGIFLNKVEINEDESRLVRGFKMLTLKPIFIIINCDEDKLNDRFDLFEDHKTINISVKIENEIQQLEEEERKEFFHSLNIEEASLDRLIKFTYNYADLLSYLTAGEKETHSWTIQNGMTASQAAGVIHSDFEKGFIRAEVIHFDDLKKAGSEAEAKKQGLYRLEGKDYIVKDGDVIIFRFNV
ncbi:MAG: YchF family ATPase [Spirochaetes bacterium]|nr:YchF family ATPase [Spirochaetota bacterium]